jgi:hypothetical protein
MVGTRPEQRNDDSDRRLLYMNTAELERTRSLDGLCNQDSENGDR